MNCGADHADVILENNHIVCNDCVAYFVDGISIAEQIVNKMNVVPFNSNENNEVGDFYPTEADYIETINYGLVHGWTPDESFSEEEKAYINSL